MSKGLDSPFAIFSPFGVMMLFVLPYIILALYCRHNRISFIDQITDNERSIKGFLKMAMIMVGVVFFTIPFWWPITALLKMMFRP